jgi:hypothetical protein
MLALVIENNRHDLPRCHGKNCFQTIRNDNVYDYKKDKETATPYRGNFSMINIDYLDAIYGDILFYTQRFIEV